jgi:hypothetical protein
MGLPDVTTLIGYAGGAAVLASFAGVAFGRLSARSAVYHAMNLAGGLALVTAGVPADAWPSVAVNATWSVISAHGLSRALKRPPLRSERRGEEYALAAR